MGRVLQRVSASGRSVSQRSSLRWVVLKGLSLLGAMLLLGALILEVYGKRASESERKWSLCIAAFLTQMGCFKEPVPAGRNAAASKVDSGSVWEGCFRE